MRLTFELLHKGDYRPLNHEIVPCLNKLGQLEDIEDKYNITSTNDLEKRLKALEIIQEKNVDVLRIKITQSVEQYNYRKIKGCRNLTQEEYDLLKEVLL